MTKGNKIVLVGCGAVGTSFVYSAMNQGLGSEYILIDIFAQAAQGNELDLLDATPNLPNPINSIKAGTYNDCKDADLIVITAGRPQKPGETRLEMVADNAKIMKQIAISIKKSGFNGITLIASNPVDVMTYVYKEVTKFDKKKVIGSGTTLDSARLRRLLAKKISEKTKTKINSQNVISYLIGEHGDSSVPLWSLSTIAGKNLQEYISNNEITKKDLDSIKEEAVKMAYKIIDLKRATFYGIGVALTKIATHILRDEKMITCVGAYLDGEYKNKGLYTGVPAVIGKAGIEKIIELKISSDEQNKFNESCKTLKENIKIAEKAIK